MTAPTPKTATAGDQPCQLYKYHWPKVMRTQYHHTKPEYLQKRVYGKTIYPADLWLCGTCHDSVHETIDWLLGEGRTPSPLPGRKVYDTAMATVRWYQGAKP